MELSEDGSEPIIRGTDALGLGGTNRDFSNGKIALSRWLTFHDERESNKIGDTAKIGSMNDFNNYPEETIVKVWYSDSGSVDTYNMEEKARKTPAWVIMFMVIAGIFLMGFSAYTLMNDYASQQAFSAPMPEEEDLFNSSSENSYSGPPANTIDWDEEFAQVDKEDSDSGAVVIPSLDIYSELVSTGADGDKMIVPDAPKTTWYENSVPIGGNEDSYGDLVGNALLASHVNHVDGQELAPFSRLNESERGTLIGVEDADGERFIYEATEMNVYSRQALPPEYFRLDGDHELHLVTCSGEIISDNDASELEYFEYNLIVSAELIEE